jgi:hypothetical protein
LVNRPTSEYISNEIDMDLDVEKLTPRDQRLLQIVNSCTAKRLVFYGDSPIEMARGVPQGALISPIFFSIFLQSLTTKFVNEAYYVGLYADDVIQMDLTAS